MKKTGFLIVLIAVIALGGAAVYGKIKSFRISNEDTDLIEIYSAVDENESEIVAETEETISQEEIIEALVEERIDMSEDIYITTPGPEDITVDEASGQMYVNNSLVVYAQRGVERSNVEALAQSYNAEISGQIGSLDIYTLRFEQAMTLEELDALSETLEKLDWVDSVVSDYLVENTADYTTNDPWTCSEGETYSSAIDEGWVFDPTWGMEAIHAEEAWGYLDQMQKVNVGVIDEVFTTDHEDVNICDVATVSAISSLSSILKSHFSRATIQSHGTHVAGIMAATADNGKGIAGVCAIPDTEIYACTVWNAVTVNHFMSGLAALIEEHDVKVINISMQSGSEEEIFGASHGNITAIKAMEDQAERASKTLRRLLDDGYEFVVCIAAGNMNDDIFYEDDSATYGYTKTESSGKACTGGGEAKYNHYLNCIEDEELSDRIIVVGSIGLSTDGGYKIAGYSSVGSRVDIVAPGTNILSAYLDNKYGYMSGTSMAAPQVSGAAALLFACDPDMTGAEVKQILCETADYSTAFDGVDAGLLQADAAVERVISAYTCEKDTAPSQFTAFELVNFSFSEIQALEWDTCTTADYSTDTYGDWACTCTYGDASVVFYFYETDYQASDAVPWVIDVKDGQMGTMNLSLTSKIHTGMTYAEICALRDEDEIFSQCTLSHELEKMDGADADYWEAYYWDEAWCYISIYLSGSGEDAVLQSFSITYG